MTSYGDSLPISRRRLLGAGALTAAAVAGVGLAGCSSDQTKSEDTAAKNSKAVRPAYKAVELVKPDRPGTQLLMSGYYSYPRNPKPVFDSPPGAGLGSLSIAYESYIPTPAGPSKNAFYALLQKRVGCTLNINFVAEADYATKFQTMTAGNDLPDICNFPLPTPDQPQVMAKLFEDLGPYLAGEHAKDYPYLANIPTASWATAITNGTIYAIPQPRPLSKQALYCRLDLIKSLGANPEPGSYQELLDLMTAVNNPKKSRWAMANTDQMIYFLQMMLGGPNAWSEQGGKFTIAQAGEQYKQAVSLTRDMVKKGLFHPDSASLAASLTDERNKFFAGQIVLHSDGTAGWDLFVRSMGGEVAGAAKLGMINEPKYDGGGDARHFAGNGSQGLTVIKKGFSQDKIKKVLNVMNFLATPIGSREHLERKYGVEGTDYTWVDGIPTLNAQGNRDFLDLQYIVDAPVTIGPEPKAAVDYQYAWHQRATKDMVLDPTVGLYSDTNSRLGSQLGMLLSDAENSVVFGRKPMSALADALKQWQKQGGDKIAQEYAESKQAQG